MSALHESGWRVKESILRESEASQTPHVSSALSCADILVALFHRAKTIRPSEVYLSKGHAALAMYATLAEFGYIDKHELSSYGDDGTVLEGHVNSRVPGIPLSTGSLGHALAFAAGRAFVDRAENSLVEHWVVLSDGELDEGSNWEALLLVNSLGLSNLNIVIDRNCLQSIRGTESTVPLEPLADKFLSFNWEVEEVDGHSLTDISAALNRASHSEKPTCLLARTKKGFPVQSMMEHGVLYHYRAATESQLREFATLRVYGEDTP